MRSQRGPWFVLTLCAVLLAPALAAAQASIAGVVRDPSGAVLPGVTVEASSPVLIEKVRTAVTDGSGLYRIVDLRAGTYTVTFTLPGFSTVKRDGIELTGSLTASVNADLRVGAVEETITVTGETPIVDVQSVTRQATISSDVLTSIPTARGYSGVMLLVPAIQTQGTSPANVQASPGMVVFGTPGGRNGNEGRLQVDGLGVGAARNGGGVSGYNADVANAQEITFTVSAGLGEAEVSGPTLSIVPKTGGNQLRGAVYLANVTSGMVGNNYSDELRAAGLGVPGKLLKLWDYTLGLGGPIKRDRLWYFLNLRNQGAHSSVSGMFANKNAGTPSWFYEADPTRQARTGASYNVASVRLTYQATPRNKFNVYWDEQKPCTGATYNATADGCRQQPEDNDFIWGGSATAAPETATYENRFQRVQQVTWNSPLTNRVLLTAGFGDYLTRWGGDEMPGNPTRSLVRVTEQCAPSCPLNGGIPNLTYRSQNWASHWMGQHNWNASMTYVTGAHSMKFGYQGTFYVDDEHIFTNDERVVYRLNNGAPNLITQRLDPNLRKLRTRYHAFYAQEQWTLGRMTLQGAAALRPCLELLARTGGGTDALPAQPDHLPAHRRRDRLQRHLAAARPGLRPLRQRQDVAQGEPGPLSRRREQQQRQLLDHQPDVAHGGQHRGRPAADHALVERRRPGLRARLQPQLQRRQRRMRRHQRPQLRHRDAEPQLRPGGARGLGRAARGLGVRRLAAAGSAAAGVGGGRLLPPLARQLLRGRQPGHGAGRLHPVLASRRRLTPGCPAAAARPSAASTTWCRPSSARSTTTS